MTLRCNLLISSSIRYPASYSFANYVGLVHWYVVVSESKSVRLTVNQILKVLDCRNELIMKDYSKVATELARISNAQNNSMNTIAREARRDSRMVKVLTVIAMAYVPAGVIAVRYPLSSSNLHLSD